jgi:hypothetical protein
MLHGDVAWEGRILATLHQLSRCKGGSRCTAEQEAWETAHRACIWRGGEETGILPPTTQEKGGVRQC